MYKSHPAAAVMPPLPDSEYQKMVESIKTDGLIDSIKLIDDLVIDGNHRQKACADAGVEPRFEQIETDNPIRFVMSCDTRRHMTTRQRSAVAAELANMTREDTLKQNQTDRPNGPSTSIKEAADLMGVSERSVKRAKKVMKEDPGAHEAIKRGEKVKAKPKEKKVERISWPTIPEKYGLLSANAGGQQRLKFKNKILAINPDIDFGGRGMDPGMAQQLAAVCTKIALQDDPDGEKDKAVSVAEEISPLLSMTAEQRLAAAIKAHKRIIDAENEYHLQERIKQELELILPDYREHHQKHLDIINAYSGVLTHSEYRLIIGLLHSDKLMGIDEIQKARFDKGFDIMRKNKDLLCGLKDSDKVVNTLPDSVAELWKRRK